jgi:hypothetical protein
MDRIIADLSRKLKLWENRLAVVDRWLEKRRGDQRGLKVKRWYLLQRMEELTLAIEALRALQGKRVPVIGDHESGAAAVRINGHRSA